MLDLVLTPIEELPTVPHWIMESNPNLIPCWQERKLRGPIVNGVTYDAFTITIYFRLSYNPKRPQTTETGIADLCLRMTHGGGTFLYDFGEHHVKSYLNHWLALPDAALFSILFCIWKAQDKAYRHGRVDEGYEYRTAFSEGRLKKRKQRGGESFKVWIENKA